MGRLRCRSSRLWAARCWAWARTATPLVPAARAATPPTLARRSRPLDSRGREAFAPRPDRVPPRSRGIVRRVHPFALEGARIDRTHSALPEQTSGLERAATAGERRAWARGRPRASPLPRAPAACAACHQHRPSSLTAGLPQLILAFAFPFRRAY